jgi:hypothetical protein
MASEHDINGKARHNRDRIEWQSSESDDSADKYLQIKKGDYITYGQNGVELKPRINLVAYRKKGFKAAPRNLSSHPGASSSHEIPAQEEATDRDSDSGFSIEGYQVYYVNYETDYGEEDSDGNLGSGKKSRSTITLKPRVDRKPGSRRKRQTDTTSEDEKSNGQESVTLKPNPATEYEEMNRYESVTLRPRSKSRQTPRKEQQADPTTEDEAPDWDGCASDREESQEPKQKRNRKRKGNSQTSSDNSDRAPAPK